MEFTEIISSLKEKFGDKLDVSKVTKMLKSPGGDKLSMSEIIEKVKGGGFLGDLDGDGKVESAFEEIKGKIGGLFGK